MICPTIPSAFPIFSLNLQWYFKFIQSSDNLQSQYIHEQWTFLIITLCIQNILLQIHFYLLFTISFGYINWLSWLFNMVNNVVLILVDCSKDDKLSLDSKISCTYLIGNITWKHKFLLYHHSHCCGWTVYVVMIMHGLKVFKLD